MRIQSRFFIFWIILILSSCKFIKPIVYNLPDEKDFQLFPYRTVQASTTGIFYFKKSKEISPEIKKIRLENKALNSTDVPLDDFVHLHKTISFLIIRNDSILYEHYADRYNDSSNVTSFSIAKAYVTMLTGIAIKEKFIKSIDEPVTHYIHEWKGNAGYELITIKDLLKHTSGLKFTESYVNPKSDQFQFYYGDELRKRILSCKVKEKPGLHFEYQSENSSLLGLILERATGKPVSTYLEEKIWSKIGTEAPALWSTDRDDSLAIEKAFCCLNARTIDFAKFGRLLLNKGNWDGIEIVPSSWIEEATKRTNENAEKLTYGYNMGLGPALYNSFYPIGLYGQWLYVYPKKNILIVRFGSADMGYNPSYWKDIMLQLVDQL